jgi:hypothetical protein
MEKPTDLYPIPPKPEWFMLHATNMQHTSTNLTTSAGVDNELEIPEHPDSSFNKMTAVQYQDYLVAHKDWANSVALLKLQYHNDAVVRRSLEKFKQVVAYYEPLDHSASASVTPPPVIVKTAGMQATLRSHLKEFHVPKLSSKPHQAEKRVNKKAANDMRTKVKANAYKAQAEILAEKTVPVIKAQRLAVQTLAELRPLHKAEEVAAKSAATRASLIAKSSPDLVPEVKPDDGWKLVTRKKGDVSKILATTTKMGAAGTQLHHANVQGDPALIRGAGRLLAATTRAPVSTGGR